MMVTQFAMLYAVFCLGVIGFQVALIAGAPWGRITQGGQVEGALPPLGRWIAGISVFLLAFMTAAVLSAAGLGADWPVWTGWLAFAVQVVSALLNWITPSVPERRLWAPITTGMAICAGVVVFGG